MAHLLRIILVLVAMGLLMMEATKTHAGIPIRQTAPAKLPAVWTVDGTEQGGEFGSAVAAAGDINGDGFADIILGAPKMQNNVYRDGIVRIYTGGPGGLAPTAVWMVGGGQTGARFGHAVSGAGDINDDGFDDLIIGAPNAGPDDDYVDNNGAGETYVVFGSSDGLASSLDLSTLNGLNGFIIKGLDAANDCHL